MKTWHKVVIVLMVIALAAGFIWYDAGHIAPKRYTTRYVSLEDKKIPEQLNDMNILFFSDLDYGTFMDEERLNTLINKINEVSPDAVIFGGDLYDENVTATEDTNNILKKAFKKIQAPYGKFAVYGDNDDASDEMKASVNDIYASSDFEVLNNTSLFLHKKGSNSITLVGLDNGLNGKQDVQSAYANVSDNNYVIAICHTPDSVTVVPEDLTDYFLAGHSHGGQAYYFFSALYTPAMANEYLRGKHEIDGRFTLDITNGVGTTKEDIRFLANAEVVVYQLHHTEEKTTKKKATPTPSASETPSSTPQSESDAAEQTQQESTGNE